MNIEKEYKYLLDETKLDDIVKALDNCGYDVETLSISQHYFNEQTRVRKINDSSIDSKFYYTFKIPLPNGNGCYEFEKAIDIDEYYAMKELAVHNLFKIRKSFFDNENTWEIDFIYDVDRIIKMIMVEVEVSNDSTRPTYFPEFLKPFLKEEIVFGDKKYSNYYIAQCV